MHQNEAVAASPGAPRCFWGGVTTGGRTHDAAPDTRAQVGAAPGDPASDVDVIGKELAPELFAEPSPVTFPTWSAPSSAPTHSRAEEDERWRRCRASIPAEGRS